MHSLSKINLYLAIAAPAAVRAASGSGHSTRYWDCCKPSCAWSGKASVSSPVLTCDANDNPLSNPDTTSGCDGGTAYTCTNNSPWAVNDDLAYGFAATAINGGTESSWCCACYALTFTTGPVAGKTMVVQSTNTGGDLSNNHFDILMPGGGVGIFDGCTPEFGGIAGAQYGGVSSRSDCDSMPELLKDGCQWRFDWFENADNPDFTFEQVQCPKAITDISGCVRDDDSSFPAAPSGSSSSSSSSSNSSKQSSSSSSSKVAAASSKATVSSSKAPIASSKTTTASSKVATTSSKATVVSSKAPASVVNEASAATDEVIATVRKPSSSCTKSKAKSSTSSSVVAVYGQCNGWTDKFPNGALACASGSTCVKQNDYYSQCVPN